VTTRLPLGQLFVDVVSFDGAIAAIVDLARAKKGGAVFTPNVDHVVQVEENIALRNAYAACELSLVDGQPLVWLSRAMGRPLPEKISGSDLVDPLCARLAAEGLTVFLLGGMPGVPEAAAAELQRRHPALRIAGTLSPPFGFEKSAGENQNVIDAVINARPDVVLVALGAPKQELWWHAHKAALAPAVGLGIGATLDFLAGTQVRAPRWMQRVGLEWVHRLVGDPKRMAERYLVRDRAIVGIAWRTWRTHRRR
jgi:N-acetylglucosaminyldiphosphoundecaprenol N-acetyl-beta-D-mannosaminyltransferase